MMEEVHSVFAAGAGAVTKLVSEGHQLIKRAAMPKYPYEYLSDEFYDRAIAEREALAREFGDKIF